VAPPERSRSVAPRDHHPAIETVPAVMAEARSLSGRSSHRRKPGAQVRETKWVRSRPVGQGVLIPVRRTPTRRPMADDDSPALDARRFLFVTGKGGVGKTTVTAALALALAARGKRVLVAMTGSHERLSAMLGTPPIGHDIAEVSEGVWATKIQPERAMEEYGAMVIRVKTIARVVFDNKYTHAFFRAVPGLFDWAMLGKAWWHTTEQLPDGSPRYDVVLFDAPSTGHGLDMLRVPKVILDLAPAGVLRRDADRAWQLFRDPARCGVVVVSMPEDMPTTETIELTHALRHELGLPVARLVVNGMHAPLFTAAERETLLADEELCEQAHRLAGGGDRGASARLGTLAAAVRRAAREQTEERNHARLLSELGLETTVLPFLLEPAGTRAGIDELAGHFGRNARCEAAPESCSQT
jgi:anion-transporting  ArsA/GET3 family ATPase